MSGIISGMVQSGNVAKDVGEKIAIDFSLSSKEKSDLVTILEQAYLSLSTEDPFLNDKTGLV